MDPPKTKKYKSTTTKITTDDDKNCGIVWKTSIQPAAKNAKNITSHGIEIPHSGWFGFFLELPITSTNESNSNNNYTSLDYGLYYYSISTTRTTVNDDNNKIQQQQQQNFIPLPLIHNHPKSKDNGKLCDLNVGKLLFFSKGTRILVAPTQSETSLTSNQNGTVTNNDDNNNNIHKKENTMQRETNNDIKWCLVASKYNTLYNDTTTASPPSDGDAANCKRPLKCLICQKTYPSVTAVLCHVKDMHTTTINKDCTLTGDNDNDEKQIQKDDSNDDIIWNQPLQIIYQDDVMAVVVKPQGMAVMGTKPSLQKSDLLLPLVGENSYTTKDVLNKPIPVHRLDAPTGGLLAIAKTKSAEVELKKAFATHSKCQKRYRAVVWGKLEPLQGECHEMLSGKQAHTKYSVVQHVSVDVSIGIPNCEYITIVDLYPVTGRNHQLRKHMKSLRHPIWGDKRYMPPDMYDSILLSSTSASSSIGPWLLSRLCLWAIELKVPHPVTRVDTTFIMENPTWIEEIVSKLQQPMAVAPTAAETTRLYNTTNQQSTN